MQYNFGILLLLAVVEAVLAGTQRAGITSVALTLATRSRRAGVTRRS